MFKPVDPKINFPENEKKILSYWEEKEIVEKYLHKNDQSPKYFSFLDGPITANNPMGIHHAWGRTYKDLFQRYHNLKGEKERFQNGFDCQGLWVEVEVEKELGLKGKKEIENLVPGDKKASITRFVELCKERVRKYSQIQTEQSKRLAYFMDWDNSYFTLSENNNYMIWHFLKVCHENGWIYKGHESIPWCPRCETAISQHEMLTEDYKEVTHESIVLKFPIVGREKEFLLVWTTTPWTIPANIAIALDSKQNYSLVADKEDYHYWLAANLADKVFKNREKEPVKTVKGEELVGLKYRGPFDHLESVSKAAKENKDKFHTVIATDDMIMPISMTEGTGLVHTAVSAGEEDFRLGKKLGLPMIPVIADNADYLPGLGEFSGKNAKKNPRIILDFLEKKESLSHDCVFEIFPYAHRYPACWRCKTELVWKVADEWYISMDRRSVKRKASSGKNDCKTLRERMVGVAKKIKWIPDFGLERELDWLKNMHDWLISKKNRYWGLALPIWECKQCDTFEVIDSKEELKLKAVSGWESFTGKSPHKPQVDEIKILCPKCKGTMERIPDVGNPWLDAGIVAYSTISENNQATEVSGRKEMPLYLSDKKGWEKWFPADFITESFPGQFKNWFYSLIAMSSALEDKPPFKTVLGFATLLGEDGRPMHKSWGNAIEFNEGADKIGVDVMRWMYVLQNPSDNLLFGYKKADEVRRKFHLMLWNIYNFFVTYANLDGWEMAKSLFEKSKIMSSRARNERGDPVGISVVSRDCFGCGLAMTMVPNAQTHSKNILDEWILLKLYKLVKIATEALDNYQVNIAAEAIQNFVYDLSTWYIRRSRDRVGPTVSDGEDKNSFYRTTFEVLITLTKLLAPFTPFIAEEIYRNLTGEDSVHLSDWPKQSLLVSNQQPELIEEMELVRKICELGHAKRKEAKMKVRQPLQKLQITNYKLQIKAELLQLIKDELNIKEIEVVAGNGELKIELETTLTPQLVEEGKARELVRQIQLIRKESGCGLSDRVSIICPDWPKQFESLIKKETLARTITRGETLQVSKA